MSIQYQNIKKFVEPHSFTVVTTQELYYSEPLEHRKIVLRCSKDHDMELCQGAYINKKSLFMRKKLPMTDFCSTCVKEQNVQLSNQRFISEIEESTKHVIKYLDSVSREVIYQCIQCGETSHSFIQNMIKNTGVCNHCQYEKFKLQFEDVTQRVANKGLTLITKTNEYVNNKTKLKLICECGNHFESVLHDINRNKLCMNCKTDRCKKTCMSLYGEDNVSKVPEIFEKIQASLFRRKQIILPLTKREIILMGYEPQAIQFLLEKEHIQEDHIRVGIDVPRFRYHDDNGTEHMYFPDIHLLNTNMIIEVKSTYTFHYHVRLNYLKFIAVIDKGYQIRLMMFGPKMELTDITFTHVKDLDQLMTI